MRKRLPTLWQETLARTRGGSVELPVASPSFRRRAWLEFQRALDPLAQPKPLPPPRP